MNALYMPQGEWKQHSDEFMTVADDGKEHPRLDEIKFIESSLEVIRMQKADISTQESRLRDRLRFLKAVRYETN